MSFLSALGNKIRNGFDDVGSFVTGQPAHGPAPTPTNTIQPPVQQAQPWHAPMALQPPPSITSQLNTSLLNPGSTTSIIAPPKPTPMFQIAPAKPHASIIHNLTHNPVTNGLGDVGKGVVSLANSNINPVTAVNQHFVAPIIHQAGALGSSSADIVRGAAASATGNEQALANANKAKSVNEPQALAPITRPVIQIVRTVEHPFSANSFVPQSQNAQRVFGSTPVQNIKAGYTTTSKTHGGLLGALYAAGQLSQDALLLAGGKKTADNITDRMPAVNPQPLNEGGYVKNPLTGSEDNLDQTKPAQTTPQKGPQLTEPQPVASAKIKPNPSTANVANPSVRAANPSAINNTTSAEDIGRALGLTDEQMAQSKISSDEAKQAVANNRAQARDTLPPEDKGIGSLQHERTPRPTAAENTAKNPVKVNIPEVQPGDYEKARSNAQLASSPIEYSAGQVTKSLRKLTPEEKGTFWKAVEDPSLIKSKEMKEAVSRWNDLSNRVHATSQALGGNTGYLKNYARHNWDLTKPEDAARFEELMNQRGGASVDPYDFAGLNRQARVFNSIKEGETAGFKLKNPTHPEQDVIDYAKGSAYALKQQALQKGMTEADMNEPLKNRSFDLRNGKTLPLSERGNHEMRAYQDIGKGKLPNRAFRVVNKKAKQTLLSASEFHPINISLLKAGPAEALAGHPVLAAKGMYGTFRSQPIFHGAKYSDRLQQSALEDGTVDAAARIGTPIKYGSDYASEGKTELGKQGLGEKAIFEKAMPAMHIRMVQGAIQDLEKRGISLDSPEARQLGDTINKTMGFINGELKNDNPHVQRILSNLALAPQFTRAKWSILADSLTKGGLAGKYARRAVVGNTAAVTAIIAGIGLLTHQKSDSWKDTVIRGLIHPSIPSPFKDAKGNNIEIRLPSTYTSEALGLSANIGRNKSGRLNVNVKPSNIPGNLANYGRARLSILPSTVLKVATNTDYSNKPLSDTNAPSGKRAIQDATTVTQGLLPIGAQSLVQNKYVKGLLPASSQEILNANKPGTNGLIKGIASAFGATPATDKTVGKGLQTQQYYDALADATKGLGPNDKAAFASIHQQSKDAVTGKYIIQPTVFDSDAKANLYLAHPAVLAADTKLNQKLQSEGQSVDPFFKLPAEQQKAYLEHETVNKNNTQQLAVDQQRYASWMPQFDKDRAVFYNSLPPGDPNKPKNPIPYPTESADVSKSFDEYNAITDPVQRGQYFGQHPELSQYMDQMTDYTNKVLVAQGLTPLKPYPKADADTESYLNTYMNADKATRAAFRTGNPQGYANMSAYMQYVDEYEVAKNGALDQLQGQTPNQKLLKGISSLANYDMVTNPDGSLALKYGTTGNGATTYGSVSALPQAGATSGSGGHRYSKSIKKQRVRYLKNVKPHAHFVRKHKPRQYFASTNAKVDGIAHFVAPSKPKTVKLSS